MATVFRQFRHLQNGKVYRWRTYKQKGREFLDYAIEKDFAEDIVLHNY